MRKYQDLLRSVLENGVLRDQRAVDKNGNPLKVKSLFGARFEHNLALGFPLLTTKAMSMKIVVVELLWFLSGSTNVKPLQEQGVHIWDAWAREDGELGPVYGESWRRWRCEDGSTFDQIGTLVNYIRWTKEDPQCRWSRRLILSSWNPSLHLSSYLYTAPMGCHSFAQFIVDNGSLHCILSQRSGDLFLGVPVNIASYALLTSLFAKVTGLTPGRLIVNYGDLHLYENHFEQVAEQLRRTPMMLPRLVLDDRITSMDGIQPEWIKLEGYVSHPAIKGEVAI